MTRPLIPLWQQRRTSAYTLLTRLSARANALTYAAGISFFTRTTFGNTIVVDTFLIIRTSILTCTVAVSFFTRTTFFNTDIVNAFLCIFIAQISAGACVVIGIVAAAASEERTGGTSCGTAAHVGSDRRLTGRTGEGALVFHTCAAVIVRRIAVRTRQICAAGASRRTAAVIRAGRRFARTAGNRTSIDITRTGFIVGRVASVTF